MSSRPNDVVDDAGWTIAGFMLAGDGIATLSSVAAIITCLVRKRSAWSTQGFASRAPKRRSALMIAANSCLGLPWRERRGGPSVGRGCNRRRMATRLGRCGFLLVAAVHDVEILYMSRRLTKHLRTSVAEVWREFNGLRRRAIPGAKFASFLLLGDRYLDSVDPLN